jgi:hypothetical protein
MANLSVSKSFTDLGIPLDLNQEQARTHARAWYDICVIARTILLAEDRPVAQLIDAGRAESVRALNEALEHGANVLAVAPPGSPSDPPGDGEPSG